jgi:glycosyltransferase involved in cell wall biosynthesis
VIDVLYVAYNRLEFTQASFQALLDNTNWGLVRWLHVHDDGSTDGTFEYLTEMVRGLDGSLGSLVSITRIDEDNRERGPVAAMNRYLAWNRGEGDGVFNADEPAEMFAKVDNDFVMPPGWLDDLHAVLSAHPDLDLLGCEPMMGLADGSHVAEDARFIGGKGLMRTRAFANGEMRPHGQNGYFGFTNWQMETEAVTKAWINPDLRCFGLDQLPIPRWRKLTDIYERKGWQRRWPEYDPASHAYWDWWTEEGS